MKTYTDAELVAMLDDIESDVVERKSGWTGSAPEKARQAVCAFANDLPNHQRPGVVLVGVDDSGAPTRLAVDDRLLQTLADIRDNGRIVPPPLLTVEKRTLKDADVAVIHVWPADAPPVSLDGRIWIRVGPRRATASAQEERVLNEKRRYGDRHFEAHPVRGCTLEDISRSIFEQEYLPGAVASDVLAANERTYEQRLATCGMVAAANEPIPTVLGLLVLGISPRTWLASAYVQFLRIDGTQLTDAIVDQAEIDGALGTLLRRLDEKMQAHLTIGSNFTSQVRERRNASYPAAALEQLARNAIMHRNYEGTNTPVRIYWFNDRIEIISPGGPYGSVTRQNFGLPGYADYRNPQLAAAFKVLGYAQRFGAGITTAQAALGQNGNPPAEFVVDDNFVVATMRKGS